MRIFQDNSEYQGTPEELDLYFRFVNGVTKETTITDPYAPFNDVLSESEKLRQELAKNADYNPFGGVVPPKNAEPDMENGKAVTAEIDTGVELI